MEGGEIYEEETKVCY